ncbi:protein Skeletor, isoforms B/C isoform X1 [Bactrocera neohumeralis]|uniref:protein Skeletor, isoforms B/C isoform X1 n=1 Tax=Bactrocera neohumeralis TaxID=98809 RepID=UPI002165C575|nr:protein Skeletor, isoforms B/C isoform X1 [Bactrocera neohumeralis]XP_050318928.1 protein Skeletor, isoforms B/C isoform X1 [Bactrocera neohumeralis]XP_050318934.1 protein Skeletor, isoforms B/C isoform X1 [Bactrocera neohumeralis]XP_050318941.1 protein Skeletor, isoforms B/C isoform X1 [Bactrocera neohumeralis]XP_050318950.1 protein Skeletor, isoforms B/C isoform X1 [Bactrocera neohumeralis]
MAPLMQILQKALIGLICVRINILVSASFPYYGTKIGALTRLHHGVSGDVYAVDSRTLFIKNFNYDGEAPAAYFYVGSTAKPSNDGAQRLRDERGGVTALNRRYRNKDITLPLPDGKTLRDFKWFSVWCDEFAVNFGHVSIPGDLDFPRPQKIASLKGVHAVSSDNIVIVDAQTLLIPNFSYDGEAPDAKFWVGRGHRPSPQGLRIPDENGKEIPLRRYDRKTIVLTLPDDLTIFDIGHFGVWCEAFTVDFGHVRIPEGLNVPPSLKMLGISPQSRLNCEVLYDDLAFEVRWAVAGDSIVIQLIAKLDDNEYMSFGVSKTHEESKMIGSDVVVAWVEKDTGKGFAVDYYLSDKSQCSGGLGVCPKVNIENGTNSIRLLNAAWVNGYSIVTYQRSLQSNNTLDVPILVNLSQAIVWGIGPLNERNEASYHTYFTRYSTRIDFGRQPIWNCPSPEGSKTGGESEEDNYDDNQQSNLQSYSAHKITLSSNNTQSEEFYDNRPQALQSPSRRQETRPLQQARPHQQPIPTPKPTSTNGAWDIPAIQCYEPEDGVFYAQMGPTGGKHGYSAITGHVGWGISWYINGLLIPEINVVRGKTYTFVVEGGIDTDIPAKYHPFYITDDSVGGYEHKREEDKKSVRIFAGVHRSRSGQVSPTGVGRLCNWTPDVDGPPADDYQSFGAYQRTLTLKCDRGEPGVITWTPDRNTPDTVYYQCFTHRYLGWKIHVHDTCDDSEFSASASEKHEELAPHFNPADADAEASIRHETKVSPNDNFLLKHQTNLLKNHNMNGTPPKLSFEITKSSEITKLISDGIRAAEALEQSIIKSTNINNANFNMSAIPKIKYDNPMEISHTQFQQQSNMKPVTSIKKNAVETISLAETPQETLQLGPLISTAVPEILHGENYVNLNEKKSQIFSQGSSKKTLSSTSSIPLNLLHHHSQHTQSHNHLYNLTHIPAQKPIGLSEFLRPPQNAELLHAVKLPGRRPLLRPLKKSPSAKPLLPYLPQRAPQISIQPVPQPSVMVSHYRKTFPGLLKTFLNEKLFPIQSVAASVLLLGEPTTLNEHRKNEATLVHTKLSSKIPVPYNDTVPQESNTTIIFVNNESHTNSKKHDKPKSTKIKNGFKPDSVIIESGFRPIVRTDGRPQHLIINQIAQRREDPGLEIDEVMETDTLFLTAQKVTQTQNFEPMFIPSPLDSTNVTNMIKIVVSSSPSSNLNEFSSNISENFPNSAKFHNFTKEDNLSEIEDERSEATDNFDGAVRKTSMKNDNPDEDSFIEPGNHSLFIEDIMSEMEQIDDENDREAQAAERIDTYYLPPDNRKIPHSSLPSGAVVTFDGKSIVDGNLVLPPKLETFESTNPRRQAHGLSQIEQLIRSTPQVQPFRGEIPQPVVEFLSNERSRNRVTGSGGGGMVGAIGFENPGPYLPLTSLSPPRVHSTKLHLLHSSTSRQ